MNKNQKGFGAPLVLIMLVLVVAIGLVAWRVVDRQKNTSSSNVPTTVMPQFTANIDAGLHSLDLKPSDRILMPSGAILTLPEINAYSVPQFNYDNTYGSSPTKSLSIGSQLEAYHNGYKYKITKGTCSTAEKSFDDYSQVVVTNCKVSVDVQKSNLPSLSPASVTKQYTVTEKNNPARGPQAILSTDPFLMVSGGNDRLTYPINNGKPYLGSSYNSSLSLSFVTDYGVVSVAFNVDEFTAQTEKQVTIAGSTLKVRPSSITCTPAYLKNGTCDIVSDKFVYDISYSRQQNNPEIVIFNLE